MTPSPVSFDGLVGQAREWGIRAVFGGGLAVSDEGEGFFLKRPLDPTGSQSPIEAFLECPLAGSTMQLFEGRIRTKGTGTFIHTTCEDKGDAFALSRKAPSAEWVRDARREPMVWHLDVSANAR